MQHEPRQSRWTLLALLAVMPAVVGACGSAPKSEPARKYPETVTAIVALDPNEEYTQSSIPVLVLLCDDDRNPVPDIRSNADLERWFNSDPVMKRRLVKAKRGKMLNLVPGRTASVSVSLASGGVTGPEIVVMAQLGGNTSPESSHYSTGLKEQKTEYTFMVRGRRIEEGG